MLEYLKANPKVRIGLGVALILLILYIAFKPEVDGWFRKGVNKAKDNTGNGNSNSMRNDLVLKQGTMNTPEVGELQRLLNNDGQKLFIDNDFGPKTTAALIAVKNVSEITLAKYREVQSIVENGGVSPQIDEELILPPNDGGGTPSTQPIKPLGEPNQGGFTMIGAGSNTGGGGTRLNPV